MEPLKAFTVLSHILENLVYTALRRVHPEIFYYKTKNGREVDFIIPGRETGPILLQVCESLANTQTRKRELAAIIDAMGELGLKLGSIITRSDEERIEFPGGFIDVVPCWRFLLQQAESIKL